MPSNPVCKSRCTLAIFAKQPRPGCVKSRLAASTSPQWASKVATAFLHDLVERFSRLGVRTVIAFDPPDAREWFGQLVQGRFDLIAQANGDLGERLTNFVQTQFQTGAERIVLVGMDSPTVPMTIIEQAFDDLGRADVVIGPATDGGYYLIGCNCFEPRLFEQIDWSGHRVLFETVARTAECGLQLAVLPPWYDVDTIEDWWMLRGHVAALRSAGIDPDVPSTEKLIESE